MPRRTRRSKRKTSDTAEAAAWFDVFRDGYDFFGDLADFGFPDCCDTRAIRAGARAAWVRFGSVFMTRWKPSEHRQKPWALEEFGEPPCR